MLKALIFDVDGTLANNEREGHLPAFNLAFKQLELDWMWSEDLYHELLKVTGGRERLKHYLNKYQPNFVCEDVDAWIAQIHRQKTLNFIDLLERGTIPLRTGVARLIFEAKAAGLRLAIATTTSLVNVETLITQTLGVEYLSAFEVIGAGDMVAQKKPASDVYDYVLEKLNLAPSECMAFEDSSNGLVSASGAGLKSIITLTEYTQSETFDGALVVLDHLGEPNTPFSMIDGQPTAHTCVSVDYVQELYAQYR